MRRPRGGDYRYRQNPKCETEKTERPSFFLGKRQLTPKIFVQGRRKTPFLKVRLALSPAETTRDPSDVTCCGPLMDAGISDATAPSVGDMGEQVRMCGVTTPLPRLRTTVSAAVNASHIPTPPPTPPPTSQCRTRAAHPCVEVSPEAALQGLVGALRARHDPPPGQRAPSRPMAGKLSMSSS